jgi:hypothetical protein
MERLLLYFGGYRKGLPDLFLLIDRKPLFVECKRMQEEISYWQKSWHEYIVNRMRIPVKICRVFLENSPQSRSENTNLSSRIKFRHTVKTIINNGKHIQENQKLLDDAQQSLRISEDEFIKIINEERIKIVEDFFQEAIKDGKYSLLEEKEFKKLSEKLGVDVYHNEETQALIRNARNKWEIENESIPKVSKASSDYYPNDFDLDSAPYYPLPPSPNKWDSSSVEEVLDINNQLFVCESTDKNWKIDDIKKLDSFERPNTIFKEIKQLENCYLLIDKKGKNKKFENKSASILLKDFNGAIIDEVGIDFDIYKMGSNPVGNHIIFLSSNSFLHAYNEKFELIYTKNLSKDWRIQRLLKSNLKSMGMLWGELRTKFRCIGIAPNGNRILFSIADTAYLYGLDSPLIWGASIPLKPGWERTFAHPELFVNKPDILEALSLMDLNFPITQEMLKTKYRELALRWHPDIKPDDPNSTLKMQKINIAFSLLTGIDPSTLNINPNENVLQYRERISGPILKNQGLSFSVTSDYPGGLNWIYGGGISVDNESVYLGTYSGKAIKINSKGKPIYTLDVGNVIFECFDNQKFVYILTTTRLYIVNHSAELINIIDVTHLGKITHFQNSIIFKNNKNITAISLDGKKMFKVYAKNPIRNFYWKEGNFIVESRTHKSRISPA